MYEGLADRLKKEIEYLASGCASFRVISSAEFEYAAWKGASRLAA